MLSVFSRFILLMAIIGLSACAVMQPKTDEEHVLARAEQRQDALLKQDFKTAYQYMSPGYRQLNSLEDFKSDYAGVYNWVSSEIKLAKCEEDICKLNVQVNYDATYMMKVNPNKTSEKFIIPNTVRETWFKLDDKWWFSKSE